jgi:lysozyme
MTLTVLRAAALLGFTVALATTGCASASPDENVGAGSSELADGVRATRPMGVDVSSHNDTVDWAKVKGAGRQTFAFARISDGLTQPDDTFADHWRDMKRVGLVRGAYQFFRARRDGIAQADLLLRMVADAGGYQPGDLPPVLDIETADNQSTSVVLSRCNAWIHRIESKLGVRPIVYTGNHMTDVIGTSFKAYVLWIAHYDVTSPRVPAGWDTWQIWQNSELGTVSGVTGKVDTNFFNGTVAELMKLTIADPKQPTPSDPTEPPTPSEQEGDEVEGDVPSNARMGDGFRAAQ